MNIQSNPKKWRVGIDLAPAARMIESPGTAVHVSHQLSALFKLNVPWDWVPVAESRLNPLLPEAEAWSPTILACQSYWRRAVFSVGNEWKRRGCRLGFATAFFTPWSGIPVVTNFFDAGMFTKEYERSWKSSGKGWNFALIKTLGLHSLWRSSQIYTDSEYWADFLRERFPSWSAKLIVAPCGVEPPKKTPQPTPTWSTSLNRPFFLFAGSFSENKNQLRLIELWSRLQELNPDLPALILPGPCSEYYRETRITPILRQLKRPEEVILPGVISDNDLAWAFQNALAYIQPSFMEGFGMPIIEAMSYGVPVACSDTTSLPSTAGNAALLFTPGNINSIESCVLAMWKDVNLRNHLREKGLERATLFDWQKNAITVANSIENTLATM